MSCPMGLITPFHIKSSTLYYESQKGVPFWGRNVRSCLNYTVRYQCKVLQNVISNTHARRLNSVISNLFLQQSYRGGNCKNYIGLAMVVKTVRPLLVEAVFTVNKVIFMHSVLWERRGRVGSLWLIQRSGRWKPDGHFLSEFCLITTDSKYI